MPTWIWVLAAAAACFDSGSERKVVYFNAVSCPACKQIQPAIEELDASGWSIRSVDILKEPDTAERWGVAQVPTVIVVEDGREIERIIGSIEHAEFKRRLTGQDSSVSASGPRNNIRGTTASPAKDAIVGENFPSKNSVLGPNHPLNQPKAAQENPFALFGENHPFFYDKKKSRKPGRQARPKTPDRQAEAKRNSDYALENGSAEVKPKRPRVHNYLPPGVTLPELPGTMAATVRIRIKYEESESVGTGTVIDNDGDENLVLTCGHLFHDEGDSRRIVVELFEDGEVVQVPGTLVDYRNDELDLGFVKFRHSRSVAKVPILPKAQQVREKDLVFSIGCDGGAPPSRRDTVVSRLNRFLGPSNIEIAGAPVQGRSGGGLFDVRGQLIGVCVAADNESDEGLFVGPEAIYGQLEQHGLTRLFD